MKSLKLIIKNTNNYRVIFGFLCQHLLQETSQTDKLNGWLGFVLCYLPWLSYICAHLVHVYFTSTTDKYQLVNHSLFLTEL